MFSTTVNGCKVGWRVVYRPPAADFSLFMETFTESLSELHLSYQKFVLLGDFNIHADDTNCNKYVHFQSFIHKFELKQHVNFPTHKSRQTLDLVLSNQTLKLVAFLPIILYLQIVLRYPSMFPVPCSYRKCPRKSLNFRNWASINAYQFEEFLFSNCSKLEIESADSGFEGMNDVFEKALEKFVPNKSLDLVPHSCACFDDELRTAKRRQRKFERVYRQSKLVTDRNKFMEASHSYHVLHYKKREKFYQTLLDDPLDSKLFILSNKWLSLNEKCLLVILILDKRKSSMIS